MGQIVSLAAKPKRCNLNQLSQVPTPAAGEHILVSSDNSMNAAGQGNFDCYIKGDGQKAATALELKKINPEIDTLEDEVFGKNKSQNFNFTIATGSVDYTKTVDVKAGKYNITVDDANNALPQYTRIYLNGTSIGYLKSLTNPITISEDVTTIRLYASAQATTSGEIVVNFEDAEPSQSLSSRIAVLEPLCEKIEPLENDVDILEEKVGELDGRIVEGTDTDFMESDPNYNLYIANKASVGYYVNGANGNLIGSGSLTASDFIPVTPNTTYHIKGGEVAINGYYAFYNARKEYISGVGGGSGYLSSLSTPNNAYFVRFTSPNSTYQNTIFSKNPLSTIDFKYTPKSNVVITPTDGAVTTPKIADGAVTEQKTIFFEHDPNSNFIDKNKLTSGYYINANGVPTSTGSRNYFITDKVFLAEGETYYKGNLFGGYCAFYREDGTLVQGYGGTAPFLPNPFVVPQGAVYGRFTLNVAGADQTCWISKSNAMPSDYRIIIKRNLIPTEDKEITPKNYFGRDISTFAKIMCIGDSLTEGAFNYLVDGGFGNNTTAASLGRPYSYPQYLAKLTGCEVTNLGKSGYTSSQWYDYYTTGEGADTDFSGYDCAIIQLGVNDNAATLDTVTKTALDNIINKVKTANAGIKIFFAGIINAKSYPAATEGESYYTKDQWLRNYYNTYYANDNQVFFVDHVAYGHLRTLGNAQHGGSYPVDNYNEGHLSAYGYWRLAQDYVNIIGYIMSHNTAQDFRKIQFIGTSYQCY